MASKERYRPVHARRRIGGLPETSMPNAAESAIRAVMEGGVELVAAWSRRRRRKVASPYLAGIHAPMRAELTLGELPVTGLIPAKLNGRYLKMGANPVRPDPAGQHWFLGDGMVHGLAVQQGKALWYRNRWIQSRGAASALGRDPAPGPRNGRSDIVNTNVVDIGGRTFAVVEAGSFPVELSEALEEQRYNPFDGTLRGAFTGHPHRDPVTGEHHAIAYDGSVWDAVRHVVISADGKVVRDVPVAVAHGPCIHDCAFTARFVVVLDLPVTFSMRAVLGGHLFPFRWNPAHRARVGLLPRHGDGADIIWCDVEPCFVFHVANAFDGEDGGIVLDVIAYPRMFTSAGSGLDALGQLERWTVDPAARRVVRRVIDPTPQEFPRIDERRFGQSYRYAYTVSVPPDGNPQLDGATRLYKHDVGTGNRAVHEFGTDHRPGEFVFVPATADAAEDEGWLLGLVINVAADTTDFMILDAGRFEAPPVATVRLPHRIPPGFHGNWFPAPPQ
jgi:carotenoid cleavage dioxygenase